MLLYINYVDNATRDQYELSLSTLRVALIKQVINLKVSKTISDVGRFNILN